jgi:hypothetical protein
MEEFQAQGQVLQQIPTQSPQTVADNLQRMLGAVSVADFEMADKWRTAPTFLTCKDIRGLLGIGKNKAYAIIKQARLTRDKYGRDYIYPKRCLLEYLVHRMNKSQENLNNEIEIIKGEM